MFMFNVKLNSQKSNHNTYNFTPLPPRLTKRNYSSAGVGGTCAQYLILPPPFHRALPTIIVMFA